MKSYCIDIVFALTRTKVVTEREWLRFLDTPAQLPGNVTTCDHFAWLIAVLTESASVSSTRKKRQADHSHRSLLPLLTHAWIWT